MNMYAKKVLSIVCAIACCTSVLGGCGKKESADNKNVTLRLWIKPSQDATEADLITHERLMEDLTEKFPEINFDIALPPQGADYRQEYDKALMAGTAPAFVNIFSYTDIPQRIKNETVADITKYVENWELKKEGKILDIFDDAISDDGKWYALPHKAYVQATLCNVKTLEAAGITKENYPTTWEEFAELGEKITDMSIPRIGYSLIGMDWCAWPFTAWVWSAGGEMVRENEDGTYQLAFNEEPAVDAAMFMNEMIWKRKMTQKDVLLDYNDIKTNVFNGSSCFAFLGFSELKQEELEQYGLNVSDYIDMPMPVKDASIPRPALAGGEVITFNPTLSQEEMDAAFAVAEYMYFSDERMQVECDERVEFNASINVMIPGRVDWFEKRLASNQGVTQEQIAALNQLRENAKAEPYCEHWSDLKTALVAPLQTIYLTENITREEAKKLLDECAEKLYSLYPDTFKK
ncbi:MAG: extracellular solute-binding protein [Ruminococcaceae bacterium]|nr:extracellular solute-binding protein [Oscillospiraceae bacterium]